MGAIESQRVSWQTTDCNLCDVPIVAAPLAASLDGKRSGICPVHLVGGQAVTILMRDWVFGPRAVQMTLFADFPEERQL